MCRAPIVLSSKVLADKGLVNLIDHAAAKNDPLLLCLLLLN